MSKLESYGLRNFYKGKFLGYVDENYIESGNMDAYISIPDIILTEPSTDIMSETITVNNIKNPESLNYNLKVDSINCIICKPIYMNNITPILSKGEEVFVFIIDEDPKKIFYASIATEINEDKKCKFILRIGHSLFFIDKDEIRMVHELPNPKSDNSITVSEFGIEIVAENIIVNGVNLGDMVKLYNDITTTSEDTNPFFIKSQNDGIIPV